MADLLIDSVVSSWVRVNTIEDQPNEFEPKKNEYPSKSRWERGKISMDRMKKDGERLIFFVVALVQEMLGKRFTQGGLGFHH